MAEKIPAGFVCFEIRRICHNSPLPTSKVSTQTTNNSLFAAQALMPVHSLFPIDKFHEGAAVGVHIGDGEFGAVVLIAAVHGEAELAAFPGQQGLFAQ